jgi:hypothetical protein
VREKARVDSSLLILISHSLRRSQRAVRRAPPYSQAVSAGIVLPRRLAPAIPGALVRVEALRRSMRARPRVTGLG